jgi:hypothetical protein
MRLALIAVSVLLSACAPITVGSYADRYGDFTGYRTYDWGPADALPTGDPRLDHNAFFVDRFEGSVEKTLGSKGYERAIDAPSADLVVHYHANVRQRVDVSAVEKNGHECINAPCVPRAADYDEATLIVDMVDGRTHKLVWRGWAQLPLNGIVESRDRLDHSVDLAVTRMLRDLPPVHPHRRIP